MIREIDRNANHKKRRARIGNKVSGTSERPRLSVYHPDARIYMQLIDGVAGHTLAQAPTLDKVLELDSIRNTDAAKAVRTLIVGRVKEKETEETVSDRSGYIYRERTAALAKAAEEAGLKFQ